MDRWAVRYDGRASFVCASCDGPDLAEKFASELRLAHCLNVWLDRAGMPSWGQLGCQGFIVCDGRGAVTCKATSVFLDVGDRAFRHVEALLEALVDDGMTEEGPAAQEADASEGVVADPAAPCSVMPAKKEAFKGVMSLGVCANDLCFCADCECGRGCTCNVASQEVEQQESCDPCTDFRRQKKSAGGITPAAVPSCANSEAGK